MEGTDWWLRMRAVLSNRGAEVAVLLVVLALVGGWVTYTTHAEPGTTTEERVVASWSRTAGFDHGATVRNANPVFEEGERLSNREVYFTRVSPVLDGNYTVEYAATDGERLDATVTLELVIRGVSRSGGSNEEADPLWQTTERLERRSVGPLRPGETVRVPFSVDVREVRNRTDRITSALGATGETEILVRADARLARRGDEASERTFAQELELVPEGSTYRVTGGGTSSQQYETTGSVTVERDHGLPRTVGGPLLFLLPVVGLLLFGAGHLRGAFELTDQEREWLAYQSDRAEFDDWIHDVELPSEAHDLPWARAGSLAALVEFAIDTDNGVVEPPEGDVFYVVHDGYLYTYTAPLPPGWSEVEPSQSTLTEGTDGAETEPSPTTLGDGTEGVEVETETD